MNTIFDKIIHFYTNNRPFVAYRKPNVTAISGFFMNDNSLEFTTNFSEEGFVFAPFDSEKKAILFSKENAQFLTENLELSNDFILKETFSSDYNSKKRYLQLIEKALDKINASVLTKVVVSRKELVNIPSFELLEIYQKLLKTYANAFVYVWFHPKVGLWLGATPETLLEITGNYFKTMSLAGTQVAASKEHVFWKTKELEEQQLVTDFIAKQLRTIANNLKINKTETIKAGNLLHLKTNVSGILSKKSDVQELIKALHPTPAVCGLPRDKAKEFILKNENYDRTFYTGFLGELNLQTSKLATKTSTLFVNLRCMNLHNTTAEIYVGGGITKDSIAKKEWEETVSKSKTMKLVL
ncbi:MAG: chorismate-binding protein [Polaribacter sp.]